jgi:hypothetical protein
VYDNDLHKEEEQPDRGVHDYNMYEGSDSDTNLIPCTTSSTMDSRQQTGATKYKIHQFTGDKLGKRQNVAPHTNNDSTPVSVFMLYFAAVFSLFVDETNC